MMHLSTASLFHGLDNATSSSEPQQKSLYDEKAAKVDICILQLTDFVIMNRFSRTSPVTASTYISAAAPQSILLCPAPSS